MALRLMLRLYRRFKTTSAPTLAAQSLRRRQDEAVTLKGDQVMWHPYDPSQEKHFVGGRIYDESWD